MLKIEFGKDNEILRKVSETITKQDFKQNLKLWKQMLKYIKNPENWWVGLAAPQIWINKRIIVVSLLKDWEDENYMTIIMINPEILEYSEEKSISKEWCLSLPWEKGEVKRYSEIKLRFFDENFKEQIIKLSWLRSFIVQHEIDHLDWILFIDDIRQK